MCAIILMYGSVIIYSLIASTEICGVMCMGDMHGWVGVIEYREWKMRFLSSRTLQSGKKLKKKDILKHKYLITMIMQCCKGWGQDPLGSFMEDLRAVGTQGKFVTVEDATTWLIWTLHYSLLPYQHHFQFLKETGKEWDSDLTWNPRTWGPSRHLGYFRQSMRGGLGSFQGLLQNSLSVCIFKICLLNTQVFEKEQVNSLE